MNLVARLTSFAVLLVLGAAMLAAPVGAYQQPAIPMRPVGFAYVNGIKAEDGTLVEARIGGVLVASTRTETLGAQKGHYVLPDIEGITGDEVHLFVGGQEANESPLPWEQGFQTVNLTVGVEPRAYTLTMVVVGSGETDPPAGPHPQSEGSDVIIRAIPADGWLFYGWIGDVADATLPVTRITMDGDKAVTANFALPTPTLSPTPTPTYFRRTPTPTSPLTPSPTRTPGPTPTSTSTPTPGPSPTPTSTPTPGPSPTATSTASPGPSPTATSTPTAGPTATGALTSISETATSGVTDTPVLTSAPITPSPTIIVLVEAETAPPTLTLIPTPTLMGATVKPPPTPSVVPSPTPPEVHGQAGGSSTLLIAMGLTAIAGIAVGVLLKKLWVRGP